MSDPLTSIGYINNNPLNLVNNPAFTWLGQTGSSGGFDTFDSMTNGIRAAALNLENYYTNYGIDTLGGITAKWAPQGQAGNDPVAYANTISGITGYGVNQPLDLTNPTVLSNVLGAMSQVELGGNVVSADSINSGVAAATGNNGTSSFNNWLSSWTGLPSGLGYSLTGDTASYQATTNANTSLAGGVTQGSTPGQVTQKIIDFVQAFGLKSAVFIIAGIILVVGLVAITRGSK